MTESVNEKIVLLVEDDKAIVDAIKRFFERDRVKIHIAKDGQEGLEVAQDIKPDLILLDILMPKVDGITMLSQVRDTDWGKDIAVIILTNLASKEKQKKSKELGVVEYIIKTDVSLVDIAEKVKKYLDCNR
ncbi:response regulator [Patescibacteria group bacterium]|nr:response regulator [Patescibacteria group bacterium]